MIIKKNINNSKIVFIRHGESLANIENRFTGWMDIDLTLNGYNNAYKVGIKLKKLNYKIDICYTSLLKRSIKTAWGILDGLNSIYTPIIHSFEFNERHYGELSGLNKNEGFKKFGKEKVWSWLNNYEESPPPLKNYFKKFFLNKNQYKKIKKSKIPLTESLNNTLDRVLEIWNKKILNDLKKKKTILIVSHSNILKILLKYINKNKKEGMELIPNTTPIIYEFDENLNKVNNYIIL